jgi:hypothetical protein
MVALKRSGVLPAWRTGRLPLLRGDSIPMASKSTD